MLLLISDAESGGFLPLPEALVVGMGLVVHRNSQLVGPEGSMSKDHVGLVPPNWDLNFSHFLLSHSYPRVSMGIL